MTRRIQPLNLLPLSWGKTICVGRGRALKIIEVMQQRPYGVRGLGSFLFSRRLWESSKMSCVWLSTRVCILPLARVCNHVTRLASCVAYALGHVSLAWCTSGASRLKILTIGSMSRSMFSRKNLIWSTLSNIRSTPSTQPSKGEQVESPRISHQQLLSQCLVEELDVELRI